MEQVWLSEPNEIDFTDEATGLTCAMRRGPMGHWCAYVRVPETHPWHGKGYSEAVKAPKALLERPTSMDEVGVIPLFCASLKSVPDEDIYPIELLVRCHGGITYSGAGSHLGAVAGRHWFGFDCAHAGDYTPKHGHPSDQYRDVAYVKAALAKMCGDLACAA